MTGLSASGPTLPAADRTEDAVRERGLGVDERDQGAADLSRLEALLTERAQENSRLRGDLARLTVLLRDRLSHHGEVSASIPAAQRELESLRVARDEAVARALEAELGRAEANFRADEVLGHLRLAETSAGTQASPQASPDDSRRDQDQQLDLANARLSGTARGLASALAEAEDARDTAQAKLLLVEQDLNDAVARGRLLEREAAEGRDQLELAMLMARGQEPPVERPDQSSESDALRGEVNGLRARVDEGERAFGGIAARFKAVRAEADAAAQALAAQPSKPPDVEPAEDALLLRIVDLEQRVARETKNRSEVATELVGARAQGMVLGEQLAREQRDSAMCVEQQGAALREVRQALMAIAASLPDRSKGTSAANPHDSAPRGLGIATEPGLSADMDGVEEQLELRDGRIALLIKHLERERARTAAVARRLNELGRGSEPPPANAIAELTALFDGESS